MKRKIGEKSTTTQVLVKNKELKLYTTKIKIFFILLSPISQISNEIKLTVPYKI